MAERSPRAKPRRGAVDDAPLYANCGDAGNADKDKRQVITGALV